MQLLSNTYPIYLCRFIVVIYDSFDIPDVVYSYELVAPAASMVKLELRSL